MGIKFRKETRFAELLTPLKNYELEKQIVEHRYDPLTGRSTVVTAGRFQYIKKLFESDDQEISRVVEETKTRCPFCPEQLERSTPKFPSTIAPEGKIAVGDAVLFPGLFAHMDHNAVAVLGRDHYLPPKELAPKRVYDAFKAGSTYLKRLWTLCNRTFYASFVGNYFPLSGSTIIHPHIHVVASDLQLQLIRELLEKSKEYYSVNMRNYWLELLTEEKHSQRYIGDIDETAWLTPFAPTSTYEVWAISRRHSSFFDMTDKDFRAFAEGLARVLSFYEDEKVSCFNFALYSGPLGEDSQKYFRVGMRVLGRFGYKQPYVSDIWGLQAILMEGESYDTSENLAQKLKKHFSERYQSTVPS